MGVPLVWRSGSPSRLEERESLSIGGVAIPLAWRSGSPCRFEEWESLSLGGVVVSFAWRSGSPSHTNNPSHLLVPLLFLLFTSLLFSILENKLIGYADDSTLMAVVPSLGVRVTVAESLISDLGRVSEWCDLWGMKLNASKTKTMIVTRSRTMHPQSAPLTIGTVLKESDDCYFGSDI